MNCREITTLKNETYKLTIEEERFVRAIERIAKMNPGRIRLFANGTIDLRFIDNWHNDTFYNHSVIGLRCEGGDGGDNK